LTIPVNDEKYVIAYLFIPTTNGKQREHCGSRVYYIFYSFLETKIDRFTCV